MNKADNIKGNIEDKQFNLEAKNSNLEDADITKSIANLNLLQGVVNTDYDLDEAEQKKIDFEFMENYIETIERERIAKLEAYLQATGLKDYNLTDEEKKWNEFISEEMLFLSQWCAIYRRIFSKYRTIL